MHARKYIFWDHHPQDSGEADVWWDQGITFKSSPNDLDSREGSGTTAGYQRFLGFSKHHSHLKAPSTAPCWAQPQRFHSGGWGLA